MKRQRRNPAAFQLLTALPEFLPCFRERFNSRPGKQLLIPEHARAGEGRCADRSQIDAPVLFAARFKHGRFYHRFPLFIRIDIIRQFFDPAVLYHHIVKSRKHSQICNYRRERVRYILPFQILPVLLFCLHDPLHICLPFSVIDPVKFLNQSFLIPNACGGIYNKNNRNRYLFFSVRGLHILPRTSRRSHSQQQRGRSRLQSPAFMSVSLIFRPPVLITVFFSFIVHAVPVRSLRESLSYM